MAKEKLTPNLMKAARVRQLRLKAGLSQLRLAGLIGVNPMTITKVERAGLISLRTAALLGEVFGVDPRELATREQ
jgi:transcriptional regulator with XRE-family HTH domain